MGIKEEFKQEKFNSRFILISIFFILATTLSWYFTYNTDHFLAVVKIASFALFGWSAWEFDVLKYNQAYFKLFILSLLLAGVGYYLLVQQNADLWLRVTKMSLCFLILFRVLRYIYILTFKREPKFERTQGALADRLFSFVVIVGTALVTMMF